MKEENKVFECNGTQYQLLFEGLYRWSREGKTSNAISGGYTSPQEAIKALNAYASSKSEKVSLVVGTEDLEDLNKKADLLKFAEENGLEVPVKHKQPNAIKKWLMGGYKD